MHFAELFKYNFQNQSNISSLIFEKINLFFYFSRDNLLN